MPLSNQSPAEPREPAALPSLWQTERVLLLSVPSAVLAWTVGLPALQAGLGAAGPTLVFLWLFGVTLWSSFAVVRHADALAVLLGEPYGTLILTMSVIGIEVVMIMAVMLTGHANPTLARDTMFSVLMIVLNGMVGLTLLLGGLRHGEQAHNLQGANVYMGLLFTLAGVGLVLPRFTTSAPGGAHGALLAGYVGFISILLYGVFLGIQTRRHRHYFQAPQRPAGDDDDKELLVGEGEHGRYALRSAGMHAVLLVAAMLPIVLLSKKLAIVLEAGLAALAAPVALGGFLVAVLVLAPEALGAVQAAQHNHLQRAVNICLGSALATMALTIPCVLLADRLLGLQIELGLEPVEIVFLTLTLLVSSVHFASGRTNLLQGLVHLALFLGYVVTIFE